MSSRRLQNGRGDRIPTKFLLVSDTQDVFPTPIFDGTSPFYEPLAKCDVFIHAGDMSSYGRTEEYEAIVDWLKHDVKAEVKIVVAGK